MIENFISAITKDSKLLILGKQYTPIAKVFYNTIGNPSVYLKIFLNDNCVLVLSPSEKFVYLGQDKGTIVSEFPSPEKIFFEGKEYSQIIRDTQIVDFVEFGEEGTYEGEVDYIDYEGIDDWTDYISIGYILEEGIRADVVGKIIELSDIEMIGN